MNHALHILSGNIELAALHGAAANENRAVIGLQFIKGDIFADFCIEVNLNAQVFHDLDFRIEDFFGKAVFGNTNRHPTARYG